jgi:hypothetical protein
MEKILLAQFIAHIIADFFAQPQCFVIQKQQNNLRSWHIYAHSAIVLVTSFLLTPSVDFILYAVAITVLHFAIDALKSAIEKKCTNPATFFIDQLLHFVIIWCAVRIYWSGGGAIPAYIDLFSVNEMLIALGLLICLKPTNVMIRACLSSMNLTVSDDADGKNLEKAGRWIGSIERILAFVLVLLGQFTAIGFIIAAKSILRYGEKDTHKAEYVLIGTLLSFGIAVLLAVCINQGVFESLFGLC